MGDPLPSQRHDERVKGVWSLRNGVHILRCLLVWNLLREEMFIEAGGHGQPRQAYADLSEIGTARGHAFEL